MNKNTWLMVLLVSILLVIDSAFILIVQLGRADDVSLNERFIQSATGNTQLELFSRKVIDKTITTKKDTTASTSISRTKPKPVASSPNVAEVTGTNGFKMLVNYDKKTIIVNGREIPWIIDEVVGTDGRPITNQPTTTSVSSWEFFSFDRFDVFVETNYYNANTPAIDDFLVNLHERYLILEQETGWSSEKFYGTKLKINITSTTGCYGGYALPGEAHIQFSNPLYKAGCERAGGIGELSDGQWPYMSVGIHEVTHSMGPFPIFVRPWLAEGFAEYNEYNILVDNGDIDQSTADNYILQGDSVYNWNDYIANDYKDGLNQDIQTSAGYDITAWMFTMLRENYSLDWNDFYTTMANNNEVLDKANSFWVQSDYFTDTHVIDLFARSSTATQTTFRYFNSSQPGWGVRFFENLNWYPDLTPSLVVSDTSPTSNETINLNATVYNNGDTNVTNVSVKFKNNDNPFYEQFVNVPAHSNVVVQTTFRSLGGLQMMKVVVDEGDIKIETDDSNNEDSINVLFSFPICGDTNFNTAITSADIIYLVNYVFRGGAAPIPYMEVGDVNANGAITSADIIYLVNYVFRGGPAPIVQPMICGPSGTAPQQGEYSYDEVIKYFNDAVASVS